MPTSSDQVVITNEQVDNTHAQKVAQATAEAIGAAVAPGQVKPVTAETPLEGIGDRLKDLGYITEADLKHGDKIRTTESKNPLKLLMGKLMRKKTTNQDLVEK